MRRLASVLLLAVLCASSVCLAAAPICKCTFDKAGWKPDEWTLVKSPRWEHFGTWVQRADHIENATPPGATPKDLLRMPLAAQSYTSMVYKTKAKGNVTIKCTMEFDDRMAPLVVIAPELGKSAKGQPEYREHFEICVFDKGVNVWHHVFKDGKPSWKKAAFATFALKPKTRYTLEVKKKNTKRGKELTVTIDGHTFGYLDDSLPEEFYVGITGCEGVNRFYDFQIGK